MSKWQQDSQCQNINKILKVTLSTKIPHVKMAARFSTPKCEHDSQCQHHPASRMPTNFPHQNTHTFKTVFSQNSKTKFERFLTDRTFNSPHLTHRTFNSPHPLLHSSPTKALPSHGYNKHTHTHIHTYVRTHTHTQTHIHAHTHHILCFTVHLPKHCPLMVTINYP